MRSKVMLSSVRRGLADVRDAAAPVITILGYDCVRFEDVTTEPVPPRAVCVRMVEQSDVYLLLLGDLYGDPMPDTDLAPTEEEWTVARGLGKPTVVFIREGSDPEPRQQDFIRRVESYQGGAWRGRFKDLPDLLAKLGPALAGAAEYLRPAVRRPLGRAVAVPWRAPDRRGQMTGASELETYLLPLEPAEPLRAMSMSWLTRTLARAGQDHGLFRDGEALRLDATEAGVIAEAEANGRRSAAGISLGRTRTVTIWEDLPGQLGGSLFDETVLRMRAARDIRLATSLGVLSGDEVTFALRLSGIDRLGVATGPNSMTYPFFGSTAPVSVEPSTALPLRTLAASADDAAAEAVAELVLRIRSR